MRCMLRTRMWPIMSNLRATGVSSSADNTRTAAPPHERGLCSASAMKQLPGRVWATWTAQSLSAPPSAPEAVHAVGARPVDDVVDHQALAHGVLGRGVVAARAVARLAALLAAVVVARHALVEHAVLVEAARERVVVDDVADHAQAAVVQRLGTGRAGKPRTERVACAQTLGAAREAPVRSSAKRRSTSALAESESSPQGHPKTPPSRAQVAP